MSILFKVERVNLCTAKDAKNHAICTYSNLSKVKQPILDGSGKPTGKFRLVEKTNYFSTGIDKATYTMYNEALEADEVLVEKGEEPIGLSEQFDMFHATHNPKGNWIVIVLENNYVNKDGEEVVGRTNWLTLK